MFDKLLDTKNSKLILQGTDKERKAWSKKIEDFQQDLQQDRSERISMYNKRKDFYRGDSGTYSNITGLLKDTKQKKGHTNQVVNYAGKTVTKMAFSMANNPPKLTCTSLDPADTAIESVRAQAVQNYHDLTLDDKSNRFWKKTYRRSCFIQAELGDAAIKTYLLDDKIKIVGHDDMSTLMVLWNGEDPTTFDGVICETYLTPTLIEFNFGIVVDPKAIATLRGTNENKEAQGTWTSNNAYATKGTSDITQGRLPTGRNNLAKLKVIEYDSADHYILKIEDEVVEFILKDDITFPKIKFWTIVHNIPNPPSPWSIADIDYLFDVQIELNDNDNRTSDYIRVGGVQRYVAYNMTDFDPESIKTSSGQVIFVSDPDGKSKFEPLPTNINNFPSDQYHQRKLNQVYDLGLPKVNYGASGGDSGRSKAIDYQSSVDVTVFKRDAWELAMQDICEKIQIFGNFLMGEEVDWFKNTDEEFVVRNLEFDWTDILPISQSDKIVNVLNKFTMGIPLIQAYKEMGYRNPDAMYEQLKAELKDPNMMILRAKAWQLSEGMLNAQINAQNEMMANQPPPQPGMPGEGGLPPTNPNQSFPVLNSSQNTGASKPMSQRGGTTSYSSAQGMMEKTRQNLGAKGQ